MTSSTTALKRVFNFNAGPSALPLSVLELAPKRRACSTRHGSGMSVMEMSHRSPEFESINAAAEAGLRKHLGIPDDYAVIFVQGGGSMQFSMVPMNLSLPGKSVDLIHTGAWTAKALSELKKGTPHRVAGSSEAGESSCVYRDRTKLRSRLTLRTAYLCTNNTIEGTQWTEFPETGAVPLAVDMSSDIASRRVDVKKFGLIFAGAQKNLGPSGVTVVIVRRDLAERADKNLPTVLQYRTHIKEKSLYQTPPTFAVYMVGLMMDWIEAEGGIAAIEKERTTPALSCSTTRLTRAADFTLARSSASLANSKMNVVFRVGKGRRRRSPRRRTIGQESRAGGHGGHSRASLRGRHARVALQRRDALKGVAALVIFMREFQRKQG